MKVSPVKVYKFPDYPTREIYVIRPELLRSSVPESWKAKGAVAGALAVFVLGWGHDRLYGQSLPTGTHEQVREEAESVQETKGEQAVDTNAVAVAPVFVHGGGYGTVGCDVIAPPVFISEDEARQIIEDQLKDVGISFDKKDAEVKDVTFEYPENTGQKIDTVKVHLELDGYSPRLNLGYEFVSVPDYENLSGDKTIGLIDNYNTLAVAEELSTKLSEYGKLNAGVFYDPMPLLEYKEGKTWEESWEASREKAVELLKAQVADFIVWIKKQGILGQ